MDRRQDEERRIELTGDHTKGSELRRGESHRCRCCHGALRPTNHVPNLHPHRPLQACSILYKTKLPMLLVRADIHRHAYLRPHTYTHDLCG